MSLDLTLVTYEVRADAAVITINRPAERNALNNTVLAELGRAVAEARDDDRVRAIVITGAGDQAFCAGGDLKEMGAPVDPLVEHRGRGGLAELFAQMWAVGKPTIARVDGFCLAGGFGLALACDVVIASDRSTFGAPEVNVGLWPYMITVPLIRSMPPKAALRLMMTGERVDPARGLELGFVTKVVPAGELDQAIADEIAAFARVSPQAIALGRSAFYSVVDHDAHGRLAELHAGLGLALTTPDAAEGLAAFREKRRPAWDRRSTGAGRA